MEVKEKNNSHQDELLPLMTNSVPEKWLLKSEKDLNETKENISKGLQVLRESIQRENLALSSDADFLLPFLRQAKFDFTKAEGKLIKFSKFYSVFEKLLASSDLKRVEAVLDSQFAGVLPFRDRKGRAVVYSRAYAWEKDLFDMSDAVVAIISLLMFSCTFPLSSICGVTYLGNAKVENFFDLIPMCSAYKAFVPYMNSVPYRIKRVDVMNTNFLCRYCYAAVRPFLPEKMKNRVFLRGGDYEALRDIYPSSMLPTFYGGTLEFQACILYKDEFLNFLNNLKSEVQKHIDS